MSDVKGKRQKGKFSWVDSIPEKAKANFPESIPDVPQNASHDKLSDVPQNANELWSKGWIAFSHVTFNYSGDSA